MWIDNSPRLTQAIMLSLVPIERFSGFQLQDKHNASIFNGLGAPNPIAKVAIISFV